MTGCATLRKSGKLRVDFANYCFVTLPLENILRFITLSMLAMFCAPLFAEPAKPAGGEMLVVDPVIHAGLKPQDAAAAITLPAGFKATLFAGEPDIVQPVAFCIDDRGRLWVAEANNYPKKALPGKDEADMPEAGGRVKALSRAIARQKRPESAARRKYHCFPAREYAETAACRRGPDGHRPRPCRARRGRGSRSIPFW